MNRKLVLLLLVGAAIVALPVAAAALGLDVEAKGGAGIALGSTDNKDITGVVRLSADGGVGADLYFLNAGPFDLGISTGVEYTYLTFHSTWADFLAPGIDQTTNSTYTYVNIPFALVGRVPAGPVKLVIRVGGFAGFFQSGTADNSYPAPFDVNNNSQKLKKDNTIMMEYGVHATAGVELGVMPNVSVEPALQFDMGLTDTTKNGAAPPLGPGDFNDRFWSLTASVGIKYKAL